MNHTRTEASFREALRICHDLFAKKLHDYGAAWRIMRPSSITDQIYIKANRIRTLETTGEALIEEGIVPEFIGIINYSIVGLIQCDLGTADNEDLTPDEALAQYERHAEESLQLMLRKNHDYDEAWRLMRVSSYTDLILMKVFRTKQIENLGGHTLVSEGVAANYMDMMNYATFALIKMVVEKDDNDETPA